jgi:hypothetical protein
MVRLEGICNFNPETTVLAHLPSGAKGKKNSDLQGAWCCSNCHDEVDRRTMIMDKEYVELSFRRGVERTQLWLEENGYIKY